MIIFKTFLFLVNLLGRKFICSRCPLMELRLNLIWFVEYYRVMICKMHGSCSIIKCIQGWKTMAYHVYDPIYCKVMTIAVCDMQSEDIEA